MKFYLILSVLSCVVLINADHHKFMQSVNECKGDASDEDVNAILSHETTLSDKGYCVLACVFKKTGMLNEDNSLNLDQIKAMFSRMQEHKPDVYNQIIELFDSCKPNPSLGECEAAKALHECTEPKMRDILPKPPHRRN